MSELVRGVSSSSEQGLDQLLGFVDDGFHQSSVYWEPVFRKMGWRQMFMRRSTHPRKKTGLGDSCLRCVPVFYGCINLELPCLTI